MSVKQPHRVGATYGERRHAASVAQQPAPEQTGFLNKIKGLIDFFNVTPKIAAFHPNTKFLDGENVDPYKALTQTGRRRPIANDANLFADLDQILTPKKPQKMA